MAYFPTLGLEIHIKLSSHSKLFCSCSNTQEFEDSTPNTHICPICTAQPGALPVLQSSALEKGILLGLALHCQIQDQSHFDRKSYFYPDLPMGYQITQYYHPTNIEGRVDFFVHSFEKLSSVRIKQAHLETDTAKMLHSGGKAHLDFNRAGTPLVEIVTYPDFHDAESAVEFLKELQRIVRINNISDADMEKGQLRVDVNLSLAPQ
jgi:aspartyl-tRNA(Asn)/glutamyl-tRNA(Gln) amidotransferase subunit B